MTTEVRDAISYLNSNVANLKYPLDNISSNLAITAGNSTDMRYKIDNLAISVNGLNAGMYSIKDAISALTSAVIAKSKEESKETKKLVAVHKWQGQNKPITFEYVGEFVQYSYEQDGSEGYPVMVVLKPDNFLDTVAVRFCKFVDAEEAKLLTEGETW